MFGQTSKATAWMLNDQTTADKIYFKYQSGYGNAGIGTTGFVDGEDHLVRCWCRTEFWCWFNYSRNRSKFSHTGQKGTILEVDQTSSSLLVGDAIGFQPHSMVLN